MVIISVIFGIIPGLAWLFFYLKEDLHPEPKKLIAYTFFVGTLSALVALVAERIVNGRVPESIWKLASPLSSGQTLYLLALALIEETAKFAVVYFAIHKNSNFDEPVDAMIYMVVAALGFATIENLGSVLDSARRGELAIFGNILTTTSLRFVGATLLHSLTSGILGYYWAIGIRELKSKKYILIGLAIATGLHMFFNYLIINYGNLIYVVLFLVITGFLVLNDFERLKIRKI